MVRFPMPTKGSCERPEVLPVCTSPHSAQVSSRSILDESIIAEGRRVAQLLTAHAFSSERSCIRSSIHAPSLANPPSTQHQSINSSQTSNPSSRTLSLYILLCLLIPAAAAFAATSASSASHTASDKA